MVNIKEVYWIHKDDTEVPEALKTDLPHPMVVLNAVGQLWKASMRTSKRPNGIDSYIDSPPIPELELLETEKKWVFYPDIHVFCDRTSQDKLIGILPEHHWDSVKAGHMRYQETSMMRAAGIPIRRSPEVFAQNQEQAERKNRDAERP